MKLTDKAQKTLDTLFSSGDGKHNAGGIIFGTTVIYNAGRAAGMKFREIQEIFMTDDLKTGYGKYDLHKLKKNVEWDAAAPAPFAAKKAATKRKAVAAQKPLTQEEKYQRMIDASSNWEVVYCAETERALEESEKMFK
jgi:hypothetical protein